MIWLSSTVLLSVFYVIIIAIIIRWLYNLWTNIFQLPPGPWGLPLVGYLPWLSNKSYLDFIELGKKYGGLFSVKLGNETIVVLNDWPTIKTCLVDRSKAFSGRPLNAISNAFGNGKGVAFSDGKIWHQHRNLTVKCLKNAGMGKSSIQSHIMDMVEQMMASLEQADGTIMLMDTIITNTVFTFAWKLVSSVELAESPEEVEDIKHHFDIILTGLRPDNPVTVFPILRFFPPKGFGYWRYQKSIQKYTLYLRRVLDKLSKQPSTKYGVVDYYIEEIRKSDSKNPPYNVDYLIGVMFDLMAAAGDTTSATTLWGFLYLILHPQVQKNVQDELDRVVGRERMPNAEDLPRLPYLSAVTMEIHRMSSILPLSLPHSTIETVQINGFTIPKRTTCLQNIYAVHHDPQLWKEPEVFKPERFLNKNGEAEAPIYLMPFSIGPRLCIGQSLGEVQLRLIFGCILHRFTLSLPENMPKPNMEPVVELSIKPPKYYAQVHARKI